MLLAFYRDAAEKYEKIIDFHIQALDAIAEKNPSVKTAKVLFLGSGTDFATVQSDFLLIRKNAEAIKGEIARRKKCLYYGRCPSAGNGQMSNVNSQLSEFIPFDPIPKEILGLEGELGKNYFGPYWVKTSCFGLTDEGKTQQIPFYLKVKRDNLIVPMMTNEKYYRDYGQTPGSATAVIDAELGIEIRPHRETADYMCANLNYLPELFAQHLGQKNGNKLATLPYLIQNTLAVADNLIYYPIYTKISRLPLEFMITRSAYSLYFGTFSTAIWRLGEQPIFLLRQNFDFRRGYTTYTDLLGRMSREDIIKLNDLPSLKEIYQSKLKK